MPPKTMITNNPGLVWKDEYGNEVSLPNFHDYFNPYDLESIKISTTTTDSTSVTASELQETDKEIIRCLESRFDSDIYSLRIALDDKDREIKELKEKVDILIKQVVSLMNGDNTPVDEIVTERLKSFFDEE